MLPILINLGPFPIRMFGVTAAVGFLVGLWLAMHEGKRQKVDPDKLQSVATPPAWSRSVVMTPPKTTPRVGSPTSSSRYGSTRVASHGPTRRQRIPSSAQCGT